MSVSKVFFTNLRAKPQQNLLKKLDALVIKAGIDTIDFERKIVAIKLHFGEPGNLAYLRPNYAARIVKMLKAKNAIPFLTDCNTLYFGRRSNAPSHLEAAFENGYNPLATDCPVIIADGIKGTDYREIELNMECCKTAKIGSAVVDADVIISMNHFKGHDMTGFGGALKNLGMGCSSRKGKLMQHSSVLPEVDRAFCTGCGACLPSCAHGALTISGGKAGINPEKCAGCDRCVSLCRENAIKIKYNSTAPMVMKKMCEFALGAIKGKEKKSLYLNFITQVSPDCDCFSHADAPIVNDIGICASSDPVALDQACADLVNAAQGNRNTALQSGFEPGGDKFRGVHPDIDWEVQLEHAEKIGVGKRSYELVKT